MTTWAVFVLALGLVVLVGVVLDRALRWRAEEARQVQARRRRR